MERDRCDMCQRPMIIIDETCQEEESDTNRKDGQEKKTDGTKIGGRLDRMEKEVFSGSD